MGMGIRIRIALVGAALSVAAPAPAAEYESFCTFDEWMISATRIHFHCHDAPTGPFGSIPPNMRYVAIDAVRQPWFAQMAIEACHNWVMRATTGNQSGRSWCMLRFRFDTDPAQNPPGCLPADCRKLVALLSWQ